ncbi:phosphatase PAP2 family protein [Acidobacteria bacterium AH-259-A15]|nr:phosphatase PAP2 family protein [Acidobacteria bacterium AH-259-A15]
MNFQFWIRTPEFCLDPMIIRLEKRYLGQPSLWWARHGSPGLTELLHFFYATYYFYTPVIAIYLDVNRRFLEFEAVSFAVMLGYALSYILFALAPVWGPRWGFIKERLLESSEQGLRGYWMTHLINYIMYQGIAYKGGAMPSAHSSTAVVFLFWCWGLWDLWGGIFAAIIVVGMWVGSIYGRYHYVVDILCGAVLGTASVWVTNNLILGRL